VIFPRINLNGNAKEQLVNELRDVHDKLVAAIEALALADYVHGRNFQTHPDPKAEQLAREQHHQRLADLHRIKCEIMEIAMEVDTQ
jgi:hypothetical protein